jgi:D-inositol-3-phosphate glycosyltransferase
MAGNRKVILIGSAYPLRGGLATFNERLIREYRKQGADASIYTFSLQYPRFLFPGKTQYSTDPAPEDIPISIRVNSVNPLNWLNVGDEIRRIKPDLVIVKFWIPFMAPCFGTICRIIKKNKHTKIISIIDNIIPHENHPGDRLLARYWVDCVDGFIAMSRSVIEDLKTFFTGNHDPVPTVYCAHPLYDNFGDPVPKDVAKQRLKLDVHTHYILFFGFIRDYKGLDLLLKAFADVRIKNYPVKLVVAGEFYCDPKPYKELIDQNGLNDKVIMSNDFIPDSQVVNYFCSADLVVQPYKSATQSGVTQIAYHFNKPMIITNVGGLAEFLPDGKAGYVVSPDPSDIADAIMRFYEEKKEQEFSRNASVEKEKYTWGKMVEAIDKLMS